MLRSLRLTALAALGSLTLASCAQMSSGSKTTGAIDQQALVDNATHVVGVMDANAGPKAAALLQKAKAVVIFPDMIKGGIGIGASHGKGVMLAHQATRWSEPAFYDSTSISLGLQIGAEESAVVMFLMTEKAYDAMLQTSTFSLKAQGGLALADLNTAGQAQISGADVVIWSKSSGAFGGLALAGSDISQDSSADRAYYGKPVFAPEIVSGKVSNPKAASLIKALGG
jgi:lipid-binding SYLF domain-containing protein|uniref:Ysc84 actin-binding domain-containing protein n=1 Tax=Acidicaldus sp. TaxID=1872105 RepID=A0A8J4HCV4_9PROT